MSKKYPDAPANAPDCLCCHDTGLVGGDITPPNDCPFKLCLCKAGRKLGAELPDAAERANRDRDRVLALAKPANNISAKSKGSL
jgi:hypothetical protein